MLANYGYSDGSGNYFIVINTDKCDGCGDCESACPAGLFQVVDEDPNDPLGEKPVAIIIPEKTNRLRYECGSCKSASDMRIPPCVAACKEAAVTHSW